MSEEEKSKIYPQSIEEELTQSYIDYSMSVIVSRALPDVRDWLKPVLRRILYAMYDLKLFPNASFKKSAAVVWEVLWKYHPHGDSSVYEALVRLTQDFSLRYPLVEWQWNFGSIDGDGAAAMRYTEARLTKIALEMLYDIEMETVDWRDNYDNSKQEPVMLPTKFPNQLCNWTMWIAVGMATNMAPHNLCEVIDASLMVIENKDISIDEIMEVIKWPDFPTWGVIYDQENIKQVYKKWKWWIVTRWKAYIEEDKNTEYIIITQLPFQVNKANFVSKIWELVNNKKIEWITDITDESNKKDIRIVITVKKWVSASDILTMIYKFTDLQTNFNINNVALVEWWIQPQLLNIKDLLLEFVNYRREVVYNRSVYQLNKAKDRLHILEGLKKAIDVLDDVIETIRWSQTRSEAKEQLIEKFEFTDAQAEYILMLRLQTLVGLEIQKILDEIEEKKELIQYLEKVISDQNELDKVVKDELIYIKDEFGDERRTEISNSAEVYELDNSIKNLRRLEELQKEDIILWIWNDFETKILYQSRINAIPDNTYEIKYVHNQYKLMAITNRGELVIKRIKDLGSHNIKWKWIDFQKDYKLQWNVVFVDIIDESFENLVMSTNENNIKKVSKELLDKLRKTPTKIMWLSADEKIINIEKTNQWSYIGVLSQDGNILIFPEEQIRASWKTAWGVKAMDLEEGVEIANMFVYHNQPFIFVYSNNAGKLLNFEDLKIQKRWQAWLQAAVLSEDEKLKWWISIEEGGVKIQETNWKIYDLHSDDIALKNRNTKLEKITNNEIDMVYRPWKELIKNNK